MTDIMIIDGMNRAIKFDKALGGLSDGQGRKTGLYHGFMSFILAHLDVLRIVIVWDTPGLVKQMSHPDYKIADDFWTRLDELKKMNSLFGAEQYYAPGYEADDLAAKIVGENEGKNIVLVSDDSDWIMMLSPNVFIYKDGKITSFEEITGGSGLSAKEFRLFLALVGTHNKVKGIPRINRNLVRALVKSVNADLEYLFACREMKGYEGFRVMLDEIYKNESQIRLNWETIGLITTGYEVKEVPAVRSLSVLLNVLDGYGLKKFQRKFRH